MTICATCGEDKPDNVYFLYKKGLEKRWKHCPQCVYKKRKAKQTPEQKQLQAEWILDWHYRNRYGITKEIFYQLAKKQKNKCALCDTDLEFNGNKGKAASLDHCHATNKIRGILCGHCNRALGLFKDSKLILQKAIEYLEK